MSEPALTAYVSVDGIADVVIVLIPRHEAARPHMDTAFQDALSTVRGLCRHLPDILGPHTDKETNEARAAIPYHYMDELMVPRDGTYGTFDLLITPRVSLTMAGQAQLERFAYAMHLAVQGCIIRGIFQETSVTLWGGNGSNMVELLMIALAGLDLADRGVKNFSVTITDTTTTPPPKPALWLSLLQRLTSRRARRRN